MSQNLSEINTVKEHLTFEEKKAPSSSSLKHKGNRSGPSPYLPLILAPDFPAGMQRSDPSLSVLNEHGAVTVLKQLAPETEGQAAAAGTHKEAPVPPLI